MNKPLVMLSVMLFCFADAKSHGQAGPPLKSGPGPARVSRPFNIRIPGPAEGVSDTGVAFYSAEFVGEGKQVMGAPYTATLQRETTQLLVDGNRIIQKVTAKVARDSMGRTRREEKLGPIGPWNVNGPNLVFISDPTTHTDYVLNAEDQTATISRRGPAEVASLEGNRSSVDFGKDFLIKAPGSIERAQAGKEALGTRILSGVTVKGTRITDTIPAGQIGNEHSIRITTDSWYSSDLHVTVMSRRHDPRIGESLYKLTNVERAEPEPSLFEVPKNYKLVGLP